MKPITLQLKSHLSSETTTLATCWKLTRRDNIVLGFTSHDRDIVFEDVTYYASVGFSPTAVASNSDLSVDNMEIDGAIDGTVILEEDISAGIYDFAGIEIFMVNYQDITQGQLNLRTGWLGEIKYGKGRFNAEVRGLMQCFSQSIGELCSPSCRAKLGDARCGLDIADFTFTGSITSISSNQVFSDSLSEEAAGYFNMGKITFTSGNNEGIPMEVKEYKSGLITLVLPMPYEVQIADEYSMQAGCDKNFDTCINRFDNAINFRGEPHVPGVDAMLRTAGTR